MKILCTTVKALCLAALVPLIKVQAQAPCDQCVDAGACFGSGPCAACDASEACTGVCEGCATAGPCRACFEEPGQAPWPWPVQVPQLGCDYAVDKAQVTVVRGEIPSWLTGTFYHAQHTNSSHDDYDGNLANPSGILAITFDQGETPVASFSLARGTNWQAVCDGPPVPPFMMDCVVTVNQFGTPGTIASVCAGGELLQFATDDAGGVDFDGLLDFTWQKNASMQDTWPYGKECEGYCPANLQPEHMPIDANGDVYSLYYSLEPAGYQIFKLPKGSTERVEVSFVKSANDKPSYTHMGPVPTANYVIIVEPPIALDLNYDWEGYHKSFDSKSLVNIYVVRKEGGELVAQYTTDIAFWTWHVANAWEDCDTDRIFLDITYDENAHSFQSFYNSTPGDFDETGMIRLTLPNPETAGLEAAAYMEPLDTAGFAIEFPVTQDQYQFAGKTGHYWMAGAKLGGQAFPLSMVAILKHEVQSGQTTATWEPEGLYMGEPFFVPKQKDQGAMSDNGAVLVVAMNATGQLFGAVLDASSLEELALFEIPMAPVPTFGLHSYFSTVSSWVSEHESCNDELGAVEGGVVEEEGDGDDSSAFAAERFASSAAFIGVLLALNL